MSKPAAYCGCGLVLTWHIRKRTLSKQRGVHFTRVWSWSLRQRPSRHTGGAHAKPQPNHGSTEHHHCFHRWNKTSRGMQWIVDKQTLQTLLAGLSCTQLCHRCNLVMKTALFVCFCAHGTTCSGGIHFKTWPHARRINGISASWRVNNFITLI